MNAEVDDLVRAMRTKPEVQLQIEETPVNMVQLCSNATSNGIRTAPTGFLDKIVNSSFSEGAAEIVMSKYFEQLSKWNKYMNAIVMRIVSHTLFTRPLAWIIKQHEYSRIIERSVW